MQKTFHYERIDPLKYGYNATKFDYPIHRDPFLFARFQEYLTDNLDIPDDLIPVYDPSDSCSHGYSFNESDTDLILLNPDRNITVYFEATETIMQKSVYGRKTVSSCKCVKQLDGHPYLLWNLGALKQEKSHKFVHYSFLLNSVHNWSLGTPYNSILTARELTMKSLMCGTSLTHQDFDKAMMGFSNQIKIRKEEFTCLGECDGDTPPVIVADGVCIAPTSKKSDHIHEFKPHEDDFDALAPSTSFKDRTFLIKKSERLILRQFVHEEITINEFLQLEFTSRNGLLIREIISRLARENVHCPDAYKAFLSDLCKQSAVSGLIQVNSREPLRILRVRRCT